MSTENALEPIPAPKVKKKPGRKPGQKLKPTQALNESIPKIRKEAGLDKNCKPIHRNEWPTRKAIEIMIHEKDGEGAECIFQLGDSPILRIRREYKVIVPYDIKGLLDDAVVDMPMCNMNVTPPHYYTQKKTRFPYSFFGEKSWEEYIEFRNMEKAKG